MTRDDFNNFCQRLPAATHTVQWHDSDVWKVGEKIFAICDRSNDFLPGIAFKASKTDYEVLRDMPGMRPAPYLATKGMKWIQRYDRPELDDENFRHRITESYHMVALGLSRQKYTELGL